MININSKAKYEVLEDVSINQIITVDRSRILMKDYLLSLKEGSNCLFSSTEQDSGKYSSDILVIIVPRQKLNIMKWATKVYGVIVEVEEKVMPYLTSILEYFEQEPTKYQEEL